MRVGRMSPGEFLLDEDVQWVVWSQLVIIGEAANRVSRQDQLKHPDIPWRLAIGMRNRAVHGYDAIDWEVVYETTMSTCQS